MNRTGSSSVTLISSNARTLSFNVIVEVSVSDNAVTLPVKVAVDPLYAP